MVVEEEKNPTKRRIEMFLITSYGIVTFIELHFSCRKIKKWRNFYTLGFCVLILRNMIHELDYYYTEDFIHKIKYKGIQRGKLWYE